MLKKALGGVKLSATWGGEKGHKKCQEVQPRKSQTEHLKGWQAVLSHKW